LGGERDLVVHAAADLELLGAFPEVRVGLQGLREVAHGLVRLSVLARAGEDLDEVVDDAAHHREPHDDEDPPVGPSRLQDVEREAELDQKDDRAYEWHRFPAFPLYYCGVTLGRASSAQS